MFRCLRLVFIALAGLVLFVSCTKDAPIQGFDPNQGFDPDDRGNIDRTILGTLEEVTFRDTLTNTGTSPFLLLGSFRDIESQILIRFDSIPDTVEVLDATILLRTNAVIGETTNKTSFTATVHQVTSDWDESTVMFENFQDAFDPNPLASSNILSVDRDPASGDDLEVEVVRFDLTEDIIETLTDSTSMFNRFGVFIDFSPDSRFIKEFFSSSNSNTLPQLELQVVGDTTDTRTISINAVEDAYLPRKLADPPPGPLYVDNVFSRQTVLKFDLSGIPRESTINRATLTLNVLNDLSIIKANGVSELTNGITIRISRLAEPFEPPNNLKVDSLAASVSETITQSTTSIIIPNEDFVTTFRRLIQDWVSERAENHGFVIRTLTPGFDISRVAFRSSDAQPESAPKLEIDFTTAPSNP